MSKISCHYLSLASEQLFMLANLHDPEMYFLPQNHQSNLFIKPSPAYYGHKGTLPSP